VTTAGDSAKAVQELIEPIDARLTPGMVDLAFMFGTSHFDDELDDVIERLQGTLPGAVIAGCTAQGTIGCDKELEQGPSMSLLVASVPDVQIRPFHVEQTAMESLNTGADWERLVGVSPESDPVFIGLGDPFRLAVYEFIERLNGAFPGAPFIGGVASAARSPGENRLIVNGEIYDQGLVGVALTGGLEVKTVVSQGCRPIGKPFVITKGERNVIHGLGGRAPLEQLQEVLLNLSPEDEQLARDSLFVGRVIDEYKDSFLRGDFLIQNIIGVDRTSGAIGIAGHARVGATVQFHVRDADSADEDLRALLAPHVEADVAGALLFGCNGRGTHMWPDPGHDAGVLHELLGDVPVAGCFCAGEFGPVGGRNFIHGFTACIALFGGTETAWGDQSDA
jgi:small ligand-binding sensory domain FIST